MEVKMQVGLIIQFLEGVRDRPGMYIGVDSQSILPFVHGFNAGCAALGVSQTFNGKDRDEVLRHIVENRGWEWSALHVSHQMQQMGRSFREIVDETLTIEIELWRHLYDVD